MLILGLSVDHGVLEGNSPVLCLSLFSHMYIFYDFVNASLLLIKSNFEFFISA